MWLVKIKFNKSDIDLSCIIAKYMHGGFGALCVTLPFFMQGLLLFLLRAHGLS